VPEQVPTYDIAETDDEDDDLAEVREPAAVGAAAMVEYTDTAALLRELSSLGMEDDDRPAPSTPAPPQRPRPAAVPDKKKKRGLFGR
jgi:hypothetical protein